jgi:uncharacterized protein YneF (UPF0154 family)
MATQFVPAAEVTSEVLRRGVYTPSAQAATLGGDSIKRLFASSTQVELLARIDSMLRDTLTPNSAEGEKGLTNAIELASSSDDGEELQALVAMFANHKEVLRRAAANPKINERTQKILMTDVICRSDLIIHRQLANNPALGPKMMRVFIQGSGDRFARHLVTLNAVSQAQEGDLQGEYSTICAEMCRDADSITAVAAIAGIQDPDTLRDIAGNKDLLFGGDYLAEVARNKHTPDAVLERLIKAENLPFGEVSGRVVEVTSRAHNTLAWRKRNREIAGPESVSAPAP